MVSLQFGFTNAVETLTWAVPGLALLLKSLLQATQENGWGEILLQAEQGNGFSPVWVR